MRIVKSLIFLTSVQALASVPSRINSNIIDLAAPETIYLSPGLVSLVEFPQNIIEVRVGNPKSVKAVISQVSPKELTIYLASGASEPSNLIVRAEKRVFVFDVVPSKSNHQDYVKIRGAYGAPNSRGRGALGAQVQIAPPQIKRQTTPVITKSKTLKVGP